MSTGTTEILTTAVVGSEKLLDSENIKISSNSSSITSKLRQAAKVVIFMGINGKLKSIVGM
jgi:cation transport ATPase